MKIAAITDFNKQSKTTNKNFKRILIMPSTEAEGRWANTAMRFLSSSCTNSRYFGGDIGDWVVFTKGENNSSLLESLWCGIRTGRLKYPKTLAQVKKMIKQQGIKDKPLVKSAEQVYYDIVNGKDVI